MDTRFTRLLDAFRQIEDGEPAEPAAFLQGLPEAGALPSPWETWTLIGLVRHRDRQLWVAEIIKTRLHGDPDELAKIGALGHPAEVPQSGSVPGLPEWEYRFHGIGCCVTHKVRGEQIDVDFWDDSAEYFDTFFYTNFLKSLRQPEPAEQRLIDLHRSFSAVTISVAALIAAGALAPRSGSDSGPYCVPESVLAYSETIDAVCAAWADPRKRLWLAALLGDWPAAQGAAGGHPELERLIAPRAEQCREIRRKKLHRQMREPSRAAHALRGLSDLGAADLDQSVEDALNSEPSGLTSAALGIVAEQDDPRWCPQVYALFNRVDPSGQYPAPYLWINSLTFLLAHEYRKADVLAALPKAGAAEVGKAAILALEHASEAALPLIRRGLVSKVPANRQRVAAILALINKPWCKRELLAALETSDDQELTADARAALLETGDRDAEKAVLAWEERNPHENEIGTYLDIGGRKVGPFYSMGEISLKDRADWLQYEMDQLHDRVMKLKSTLPDRLG